MDVCARVLVIRTVTDHIMKLHALQSDVGSRCALNGVAFWIKAPKFPLQ